MISPKSPNPPIEIQGFLPLNRAAAWAGVSTRTLKRWIEHGLPVYQPYPKGRILVKLSDIEAFLQRKQEGKVDLDQMVEEVTSQLCCGQAQ